MKKILSILLSLLVLLSSITAFGAENKFGVDVSEHNGDIDYVYQSENGVSFVMIRLGYFNHLDKRFWQNVEAVSKAGLNFGVYLYSYAYDLDEARIEADFVTSTLAQMPAEYDQYFTMPVAYDMEDAQLTKFGKSQLTSQAVLFLDAINYAGYTPMIYANTNWFNNYLDANKLYSNGYKFWLADWKDNVSFDKQATVSNTSIPADIWQYQSGSNHPSGLDQNVVYDMPSLMHKYFLVSDTQPNCGFDGKRVFSCSISGETKTITFPATGNHNFVLQKTVNATCGKAGSKIYICSVCNSTKTDTIKATGKHTYTAKVTKAPTSKVAGIMTYTCKCGAKYTKSIAKLPSASISKLTATKKGFKAQWKKVSSATGYQIRYSTSSKMSKAKTVTISKNSTVSKSVSKLLANKKYFVQIRTYKTINGKKYYSSWSKAKAVTTKK